MGIYTADVAEAIKQVEGCSTRYVDLKFYCEFGVRSASHRSFQLSKKDALNYLRAIKQSRLPCFYGSRLFPRSAYCHAEECSNAGLSVFSLGTVYKSHASLFKAIRKDLGGDIKLVSYASKKHEVHLETPDSNPETAVNLRLRMPMYLSGLHDLRDIYTLIFGRQPEGSVSAVIFD